MYEVIRANIWKSRLLIILFIIITSAIIYVFSKVYGNPIVIVIGGLFVIGAPIAGHYAGDKIILSLSGARNADRDDYPHYINSVEGLALAAGLPTPKAYVIDDTAPNAFATGRDPEHSAICVTTGLLELMNRVELEGVIAHEMSHIKNYDSRLMMIISILVGFIALLADWIRWGDIRSIKKDNAPIMLLWIILLVFSPIVAMCMQAFISRRREYLADSDAALLTRYPPGLASALKKIRDDKHKLQNVNRATAHLYIVNPINDHGWKANKLYNTHPPIDERIKILEEM